MDPLAEPPKTKLSRTSRPKVRTGCVTCKQRRIKCDETKPHCTNCLKRSGYCEGYAEIRPRKNRRRATPRPFIWDTTDTRLSRLISPPALSERSLGALSFYDEPSKIYFQEFISLVQRPWIAGASFHDLWEVTLPQLSHRSPTLRHAAMAIGAMCAWNRQIHRRGLPVPSSPGQTSRKDETHYIRALSHYSQSLKLQNEQPSLLDTIFLSVLLLTFESMRGNRKAALDHINHGLALLLAVITDETHQHMDVFAPDPKPLLGAVAVIFSQLGIQARYILRGRIGEERPLPNFTKGLQARHQTIESFAVLIDRLTPSSVDLNYIPVLFSSLDEFETYWIAAQHQHQEMNSILLDKIYSSGVLGSDDDGVINHFWRHLLDDNCLSTFCERSKTLTKTLDDAFLPLFNTIIASDVDPRTYVRAIHLRLQCFGVHVFESPPQFIKVETLMARTSLFKDYLALADIAMRAAERGAENPAYQLSLQNDLVWRLFIIAFFCRDPLVREVALWKIRDYPGHDGLWNTRSLFALALRNRAVEWANAAEGTPDEQWKRLLRREYVFEDGGDRIIFRYLEKNPFTGDWNLVEEATDVNRKLEDVSWERQSLSASGKLLMSCLLAG